VLLAAEGRSTRSIAEEVGVQPRIVSNWRRRFADHGLAGLEDRPLEAPNVLNINREHNIDLAARKPWCESNDPHSRRKLPMWSVSILTRAPRRSFSVSTKSLRSRPWSVRKAI
jgi:transposase-like protein